MTPVDPDVQYAFWADPNGEFSVRYSLPLFHEIDFQVNEGYRRIPHGGIEIGGVLYGRIEGTAVRVDAFRPIECEHASGPSFSLSPRDLYGLAEQLSQTKDEGDLKGLEPVGWFVSHTRSQLDMNAREAEIFGQYFTRPGQITVIVRPERFQPTRFAFYGRSREAALRTGAAQNVVILPMPGRASRTAGVPVASIPAPGSQPTAPKATTTAEPKAMATAEPKATTSVERPVAVEPKDVLPAPVTVAQPGPPPPAPPTLPSPEEIRRRRSDYMRGTVGDDPWRAKTAARRPATRPTSANLALVLLCASLLGCGAGYLAYLQLPAATIDLHVQKLSSSLLVRWPAEQTRNCPFAAIRVDDQEPKPLTEEQKKSGEFEIKPTSQNTKVELIAQHWIRDSRGIIRYIGAVETKPAANMSGTSSPVFQEQSAGVPEEER